MGLHESEARLVYTESCQGYTGRQSQSKNRNKIKKMKNFRKDILSQVHDSFNWKNVRKFEHKEDYDVV